MRFRTALATLAAYSTVGAAQVEISITTANGTESEKRTRTQLERILALHDLDKWILSTDVVIDEKAIPHSHPVLTLHTRHTDDLQLLSALIHEQLHWHLVAHWERVELAIEELRERYPTVPTGGREGARSAESTYLHLLVNYLEYDAMRQIVGEVHAREVMEFLATDHYTWIYGTVLSDEEQIGDLIDRFALGI